MSAILHLCFHVDIDMYINRGVHQHTMSMKLTARAVARFLLDGVKVGWLVVEIEGVIDFTLLNFRPFCLDRAAVALMFLLPLI